MLQLIKIDFDDKNCSQYCKEGKYEYNNFCFNSCPKGTHISINNNYLCEEDLICLKYYNYNKTECLNDLPQGYYLNDSFLRTIDKCDNKCKICTIESNINNLCISCNIENSYYPIYNDNSNNNEFIDCYNSDNISEGYYLDTINNIYNLCFPSCKKCNELGNETNNNCLECKSDYEFKEDFINVKNCYKKCDNYYYFDSFNRYNCTLNKSCPVNYNKFVIEKNKCIDDCKKDNIYKYEYNNTCYKSPISNILPNFNSNNFFKGDNEFIFNNSNTNNQNSLINDEIINIIKNDIINGNIDLTTILSDEKKDLIIKTNNIIYQITSSDNQKNNEYNNVSTILLGECENILKKEYNISENQSLIILKIDYYKQDSLIPIIGYDIFHPITNEKLNLTYCDNELINYNIPVSIDENILFKYDPKNEYYTDDCQPYTTENGTDILLNDRHNEYNNNSMSLCENICNFKEYITSTKKANCECEMKNKQISISELVNNTNIFIYNFTNKEESSNMITMKCANVLFTKEGISKNIANYILIFIITFFMISGIIFNKCSYPLIESDINEIMILKEAKNNNDNNNNIQETLNIGGKGKKINKIKKNKKKIKSKKINSKNNSKQENNHQIIINSNDNSKYNLNLSPNYKNNKTLGKVKNDINKSNEKSILKHLNTYNDNELNTLSYNKALKYDKRNFLKYYKSLIVIKHPLFFSFYINKDYNSMVIKIDLFFLSFSVYYFINALFFDESTIHKIYEDEGIYNFIYLVPYISYSFIIFNTLTIIIKYLSLSERNIYEIKNENNIIKANDKISKIKKCLIIKYIIFYISSVLFLAFLWYYLSSFGAVYQNTQIYLIKNTLISVGFSLVYPFIINFIPAFIRIYALKDKKKNREFIFKANKIIQLI